ncbi:MAG: transglycosylase domain-containing protein [Anaerovoracaceae bacterium]|jgi:penicillin-binding protein 1A
MRSDKYDNLDDNTKKNNITEGSEPSSENTSLSGIASSGSDTKITMNSDEIQAVIASAEADVRAKNEAADEVKTSVLSSDTGNVPEADETPAFSSSDEIVSPAEAVAFPEKAAAYRNGAEDASDADTEHSEASPSNTPEVSGNAQDDAPVQKEAAGPEKEQNTAGSPAGSTPADNSDIPQENTAAAEKNGTVVTMNEDEINQVIASAEADVKQAREEAKSGQQQEGSPSEDLPEYLHYDESIGKPSDSKGSANSGIEDTAIAAGIFSGRTGEESAADTGTPASSESTDQGSSRQPSGSETQSAGKSQNPESTAGEAHPARKTTADSQTPGGTAPAIAAAGTTAAAAGHKQRKGHQILKDKKNWSKPKKIIVGILLAILAIILALIIYATVVIINAPKIDTDEIYSILTQTSTLYDSNSKEIDSVYSGENRKNVKYEELPENLKNAFIALEDKTFWKHHGFNFIRILGAIKNSIFSGEQVSGTSTLTQQLARNVFLKSSMTSHTLKRKIIEAWYTVKLETHLSKKEIITAYLNTVSFGYGCNGVEAASEAYFHKHVSELDLAECAELASIVKAPTAYAPVVLMERGAKLSDNTTILKRSSQGTYILNDAAKSRRELCLKLMKDQGYITNAQYKKAKSVSLKEMINPRYSLSSSKHAYFTDYVVSDVIEDLQKEKGLSYKEAYDKVYTGGLKIYTTMDLQAQKTVEKEFRDNSNFPSPTNISYDGNGNIIDKYGNIVMYSLDRMFTNGNYVMDSTEARQNSDGSITIYANKYLKIYTTTSDGKTDYSVEFPNMYKFRGGHLYSISGGTINIPQKYKSMDSSGNIVVSKKFLNSRAGKTVFSVKNGTITIKKNGYTLNQSVIQPQAAMTIIENSTGEIKAMVGGRKTSGRMLYNRATETRQPGSSVKPLSVYSAALQQSAEEAKKGKKHTFVDYGIDSQGASGWGSYITAGSTVIDEKTIVQGKVWPVNDGGGYSGYQTFRTALKHSLNTCAVKIWYQVGESYSEKMLKKYGISSLDTKGSVNDKNAAALALGGMTNGVSTLEMANAYTVFPNNGTKTEDPISYTVVKDSDGHTILKNPGSKRVRVLDKGVAWIMRDVMCGVVESGGTGVNAAISGVDVAGKTGTTSDHYDIWFDGYTPTYTASLWIGNDVNITLTSESGAAAALWGKIMGQISAAKKGTWKSMPSDVQKVGNEYYVKGTYGGSTYYNYNSGSSSSDSSDSSSNTYNNNSNNTNNDSTNNYNNNSTQNRTQNSNQNNGGE